MCPFYDYINKDDPDDVLEGAFFGSFDDKPETIEENGKTYVFKPNYPVADPIFKVKASDSSGWTPNSKIGYSTPEELKEIENFKQMKNKRNIDKERYGIGG